MIRLFDILLSLLGVFIFFPIFFLFTALCFIDTGSPLFFQQRVGINLKSFKLIKFRTMKVGVESIGTHLVNPSNITIIGNLLRRSKLDEFPQLYNILVGDMSFVGPRPCLFNQKKLIKERKKRGIFKVLPGVTGLSQITGITMKSPTLLAKTDLMMIKKMNLFYYFYYLLMTVKIFYKKKYK